MTEIDDLEDIGHAVITDKTVGPHSKNARQMSILTQNMGLSRRGKSAASNAGRVDPHRADARLRKF